MAESRHQDSGMDVQGAALIELVIERVRVNPRCIAGFCNDYPLVEPQPLPQDTIETLTFPNGKPLPPSLKRWLAFDASWLIGLGWFPALSPIRFTERSLQKIVYDEFGRVFGEWFASLGRRIETCFLLPGGSDSRRLYAVTEPDALGEYPILVVDTDDIPYIGIMYPGFDVYMAELSGVLTFSRSTYEDLFDDPRYAERLQWHANQLFSGKSGIECGDEEWLADIPDDDRQTEES